MMKLVATCAVVALLASQVEPARPKSRTRSAIAKAFKQFIPEYIARPPPNILNATFGGVEVTLGAELTTSDTAQPPVIEYPLKKGIYYTFMFLNVDYLSARDPSLGPLLLYLIVNICDEITEGNFCTVARYLSPNPRAGSGIHRFLLLLYTQEGVIDAEDPNIAQYQFRRLGFPIEDFASNNTLCLEAGTYILIENQCKV